MFGKKRTINVSVGKEDTKPKHAAQDATGPTFFDKVDYVLHKTEKIGVKVFIGVVLYVAADTVRKVAVETSKKDLSTD